MNFTLPAIVLIYLILPAD